MHLCPIAAHNKLMLVLIIRTLLIFAFLNIALRLTGKRQIGELELSELITTLLLSELAATPILDPDIPLSYAIVPILFLSALEIALTYITSHNQKIKALVDGKPSVVIRGGTIVQSELENIRMSCVELLGQLRQAGVGDPRDVKYALFEEDGKLSVFKVDSPSGAILHVLFAEGSVNRANLDLCGKDEAWLNARIRDTGLDGGGIFMLAISDSDEIVVVPKDGGKQRKKRKGKK